MLTRIASLALGLGLTATLSVAQSPERLGLAVGQALPTQGKFGLFPILRGEWFITSASRPVGLLADAYLARAFPNTSRIDPDLGYRVFRGTEYGAAVSLVFHARPRGGVSPYLVAGLLGRVASSRDSTSTPPAFGVSDGTDTSIEPNLGLGLRVRVAQRKALRFELRYYDGLVYVPLTVGLSFSLAPNATSPRDSLVMPVPTLPRAQAPDSAVAPRQRTFTMTAGFGNAMGWLGLQGEKYLSGERFSVFSGLGYTPQVDQGASGVTVAAGVRGYTPGTKHRGFLELSVSQLAIEQFCFDTCRRHYGPGVQAGYQFATRGGFTLAASFGVGYAPWVPAGASKVGTMAGFGLGYTWRH